MKVTFTESMALNTSLGARVIAQAAEIRLLREMLARERTRIKVTAPEPPMLSWDDVYVHAETLGYSVPGVPKRIPTTQQRINELEERLIALENRDG